jgi:hypothetical protein
MLDSLAEISFREVYGTSLLESGCIPLDLFVPGGIASYGIDKLKPCEN